MTARELAHQLLALPDPDVVAVVSDSSHGPSEVSDIVQTDILKVNGLLTDYWYGEGATRHEVAIIR